METWILTPLLFAVGYLFGRWHNRRWRRERFAALGRKLQLIAERNKSKGFRHKRKRPVLNRWQKFLLGWLLHISPTLTHYTNFRPETLVGWHRRFVKRWWTMLVINGKRRAAGRPRIDSTVEKIIVDIKADNPSYGNIRRGTATSGSGE